MASALENLFAAQQLFRPVAESAERISQQRRQEALLNLRRQQELQDQQAAEALRIRLAEMQIGADDRRTEAMIKREESRAAAAETIAAERAKAAQELADAKTKEERERIARNAVRTAFANYKKAGGSKKLTEFGTETDEGTYYAILDEMPELERSTAIDTFKGQARVLGQQESALNSLLSLSRDEDKEFFDNGVSGLMSSTDKSLAKAGAWLSEKLAEGKQSPEQVMMDFGKRYPQAASALKAQITASRNLRQMEKSQSKEAQQLMRETAQLRNALVEFGGKNRIPDDVFGQLFQARDLPRDLATDDTAHTSAMNVDGLRAQLGVAAPATSIAPAPGAADVTSPYGEYGGLKGMIRNIPQAVDTMRYDAMTSPWSVTRNLGDPFRYLIGGRRQVEEAEAERAAEASALAALIKRRRDAQQSVYAPVVLDALLRSRQPAQPPVNPFVLNR